MLCNPTAPFVANGPHRLLIDIFVVRHTRGHTHTHTQTCSLQYFTTAAVGEVRKNFNDYLLQHGENVSTKLNLHFF